MAIPGADMGTINTTGMLAGGIGGGRLSDDIDDLIPEELRAAVGELADDSDEEESVKEIKKSQKPAEIDDKDPLADDESDDEDDELPPSMKPQMSDEDDDLIDDLDLSDEESVEKLVKGDLESLKKQAAKDDEVIPWHDDEKYKQLLDKVQYAGLEQEELDSFLQELSDKKLLENTKYVEGLKEEVTTTKNRQEQLEAEITRLREVERVAFYQQSEEVDVKYRKPMNSIASEIASIMDYEGIKDIPLSHVLATKDRSSLIKLFEKSELEDDSRVKLFNYWKSFRDLDLSYNEDLKTAKKDLAKLSSTNVSPEVAKKVLRNKLDDYIKSKPENTYIKTAILEGLEKHPEVNEVIALSRDNFNDLLTVLATPSDYVRNDKWLGELATYTLDSAHNKILAKKYFKQKDEQKKLEENFKVLAKAFVKLRNSGKGISNDNSAGLFLKSDKKSSKAKGSEEDIFNKFLKNQLKFEDLIDD